MIGVRAVLETCPSVDHEHRGAVERWLPSVFPCVGPALFEVFVSWYFWELSLPLY